MPIWLQEQRSRHIREKSAQELTLSLLAQHAFGEICIYKDAGGFDSMSLACNNLE